MYEILDNDRASIERACRAYGYEIKLILPLPEIHSTLHELEHTITGARHIHIGNHDQENTFSVAFKTIPTDSTGVAHILEHVVLCGSKKFPVRDPFFSMLKRSLSTFMNAFTSSDWTMYPFSTQNEKDYYNLMDVYLDAAFYPNIDIVSFKQEGHRVELADGLTEDDGPVLVYKGVVYNEMKGAMSSPDQIMVRSLFKTMYPDTTYSNNSGGDPVEIPKLTHQQLKRFHETHYHPSNSFFYTYGNMSLSKRLAFIHEKVLKNFSRIDPATNVASQPRWQAPKKAKTYYPISPDEDRSKKSQVCVAWLTSDIKDAFQTLVLKLLEQILLGNSASPIRKALIESQLGTALSDGTGFDADNRDMLFACGLKDVSEADAGKIEKIIFEVLHQLGREGIDKRLIDSAIHQIEFHHKEITNTPYPYGIKLFLSFVGSWLHGGSPEKILMFDADLKRLRNAVAAGGFFEKQIRELFIENPHRALFILSPDADLARKEKDRVRSELKDFKESISEDALVDIENDAAALKRLQESTEDISCLPTLDLKDIPQSVHVEKASDCEGSITATCYCRSTSGIFYTTAAIGTGSLEPRQLPKIPFFCYVLPKIGTKRYDFTEMVQRIDAYTGGIKLTANARTRFDETGTSMPFLTISGKCLNRNLSSMFEILEDILYDVSFSNLSRLKSLLLEYRAGLESRIVHNGHRYAILLSSRNFSTSSFINESWSGVHQLKFMKNVTKRLEEDDLNTLAEELADIRDRILIKGNLKMALIGEAEPVRQGTSIISNSSFSSDIEQDISGHPHFRAPELNIQGGLPREGWSTSTSVSFVAKTFKGVRMDHEDAASLSVIAKMLRSLFLHREIREKGGAYGGFALYNIENGLFSFASYRDPHILSTLDVYDRASTFITSGNFSEADIKEAILQVCSDIDKPDPPGPAAKKAFYRRLISMTDEARLRFKERLLSLKKKDVMETAGRYFGENERKEGIAVISSEDLLRNFNKKIPGNPLTLHKI